MTRAEKARTVAQRVAVRIREVSPTGLGHWDPAWDHVGTPSDVFMDALKEWEKVDSPSTRSQLEAASTDLIEAWVEAGRQWEAAGRPTLDERKGISLTEPEEKFEVEAQTNPALRS